MTTSTKVIDAIADALIAEYDQNATEWLQSGGRANVQRIVAEWANVRSGRHGSERIEPRPQIPLLTNSTVAHAFASHAHCHLRYLLRLWHSWPIFCLSG